MKSFNFIFLFSFFLSCGLDQDGSYYDFLRVSPHLQVTLPSGDIVTGAEDPILDDIKSEIYNYLVGRSTPLIDVYRYSSSNSSDRMFCTNGAIYVSSSYIEGLKTTGNGIGRSIMTMDLLTLINLLSADISEEEDVDSTIVSMRWDALISMADSTDPDELKDLLFAIDNMQPPQFLNSSNNPI